MDEKTKHENQEADSSQEDQASGDRESGSNPAETGAQKPPPTLLEWSVRLVGGAVLVALIVYLVTLSLAAERPTSFDFEIDRAKVQRQGDEWRVPVRIINRGSTAIADLEVAMTAIGDEGNPATASIYLLGAGEGTNVVFWLPEDPRASDYRFDVVAHREP